MVETEPFRPPGRDTKILIELLPASHYFIGMVCLISQPRDVLLRRSGKPKFAYAAFSPVAYGMRSYSPELGRWINRDPIGEGGGVNIYITVNNSPTNAVDAKGEFIVITTALTVSAKLLAATIGGAIITYATTVGITGVVVDELERTGFDGPCNCLEERAAEKNVDLLGGPEDWAGWTSIQKWIYCSYCLDCMNGMKKIKATAEVSKSLIEATPGTGITGPPAASVDDLYQIFGQTVVNQVGNLLIPGEMTLQSEDSENLYYEGTGYGWVDSSAAPCAPSLCKELNMIPSPNL